MKHSKLSGPLTELRNVYQVHTDGIMSSRGMGDGLSTVTVRFDISPTLDLARSCESAGCARSIGRGFDGSSGAVFVPAGHYVRAQIDQLVEDGNATIFWQPLNGPDPSGSGPKLIESDHL